MKISFFTIVLLLFCNLFLSTKSNAQDIDFQKADLAQTPPMGWNSFDSYAIYINEEQAHQNLDQFIKLLKPLGYEYFVIDLGWYAEYTLIEGTNYPSKKEADKLAMDEYGRLEPSKVYFPNGLKPLIEKAHAAGVKFGLHMMRGIPKQAVEQNLPVWGTNYHAADIADKTSTCGFCTYNYGVDMTKPGAQEYYNSVYKKLADWGVDFVKVDDLVPYPKEIVAVGKAVANSGRPMVLSLSPGRYASLDRIPYFRASHMFRTTPDVWDHQPSIDGIFDSMRMWQGHGHAGFWPDHDMIPFGRLCVTKKAELYPEGADARLAARGFDRDSEFNDAQKRTFITQLAISASPLMLGADLVSFEKYEYDLKLVTEPEVIACVKNGMSGVLAKEENGVEYWRAGQTSTGIKGWMAIFNRSETAQNIALTSNLLREPHNTKLEIDFEVKDVWSNMKYEVSKKPVSITIQPNDVLFIRFIEATK